MDFSDKKWMSLPRSTEEFLNGVDDFLDKSFARSSKGNEISCPCKKCCFRYWYRRNIVYDHLIRDGFTPGYLNWHFHGEDLHPKPINTDEGNDVDCEDDINALLHNSFRDVVEELQSIPEEIREEPNMEAKKFFKLVEEGQQELYPGCKKFSKLSFIIRLYLFKCTYGISNVAFTSLLELLREAFPYANIPSSFNAAKNIIKDLGLDYEKIHACPNDCMLFWGNNEEAKLCDVCGASRWKVDENSEQTNSFKGHQVPAKVFRYFPLKPRLQRLFMSPKTAESMLWHVKERPTDGALRHPADGQAWKDFNSRYPNFAKEPRNVRLGLASDGFNPFRTMSISHSTWPIVLSIYNLAPWQCIKPEFLILSSIIPGPTSPGKDIDIYMQPLIKELKELWEDGVDTYDASAKQSFLLRANLMWTVSDFPAYAMLAGWVSKGKFACPLCHYETCSQYLKYSRKTCYMNHRRFLPTSHPWRYDTKSFNGKVEDELAPSSLSGTDVRQLTSGFPNCFGKSKKRKKPDKDNPWRKRSIFFDLPYWELNTCHHNLDVMHIEKNICDSILGTLLDIPGKTKDHINARLDLKDMGIRTELHPIPSNSRQRMILAKACFSMTAHEKEIFCSVLKDAKLPQGCASNISRCVDITGKKISGYKSHDAHFIMHHLLQIAVIKSLPKHVAIALIRLGAFFKGVYSKVVKIDDLDRLQFEICETLCLLEMIFPPSFFDIMVHLPIHLTNQIKLGGPVHCRSMYFVERYLGRLKGYVRNRSRPEASIAEGYLAEECLIFCSRFLNDVPEVENGERGSYNNVLSSLFPTEGHPIGGRLKKFGKPIKLIMEEKEHAHRYILFNCGDKEVEKYIK